MGGDPLPAPITFLATEHFRSLSSIPLGPRTQSPPPATHLGPDEYTRLAAIDSAFSASDLEDYMLWLAESFPEHFPRPSRLRQRVGPDGRQMGWRRLTPAGC
jgi:hypothetical protein